MVTVGQVLKHVLSVVRGMLSDPVQRHDAVLYLITFLTLWFSGVPLGGGWDSLLAALPPAASAFMRWLATRNTGGSVVK